MKNILHIRDMQPGEEHLLWELHRSTIRNINLHDYSPSQLNAWAPDNMNPDNWIAKMQSIRPFLVHKNNQIIGYSDLQTNGLIDHLFVHYQWQRHGVGQMLMTEIQNRAIAAKLLYLESHVSVTARPFFERFGFAVTKEQALFLRGETLKNYIMRQTITYT